MIVYAWVSNSKCNFGFARGAKGGIFDYVTSGMWSLHVPCGCLGGGFDGIVAPQGSRINDMAGTYLSCNCPTRLSQGLATDTDFVLFVAYPWACLSTFLHYIDLRKSYSILFIILNRPVYSLKKNLS